MVPAVALAKKPEAPVKNPTVPARKIVAPVKKATVPAKKVVTPAKKVTTPADHSSNYNVREALKKLRTKKTREELLGFVKGETRVTVTKVIPARLNRL